ncbi:hypothetical protein Tsp_14857 [Trichinella spiralis]|uniref:hypothetical protein n=1 Tax=Trichinella spiralis TaxID=6334 RepID=UPI0001EFDAAB|nr:hypothetical protein Tsp_14857 [Trichinella spiralis]
MPFNKVPTSLSLDRPSLHFDSVRPHFPIRLFGIRQYCNQYCKPRILSRLLATNASSCTTIVPLTHTHTDVSLLSPGQYISGAARFLALYIGPGSAAPRSTQTRTTNRQLARGGSARYLRRRSKALSVFNYVVLVRIS